MPASLSIWAISRTAVRCLSLLKQLVSQYLAFCRGSHFRFPPRLHLLGGSNIRACARFARSTIPNGARAKQGVSTLRLLSVVIFVCCHVFAIASFLKISASCKISFLFTLSRLGSAIYYFIDVRDYYPVCK